MKIIEHTSTTEKIKKLWLKKMQGLDNNYSNSRTIAYV